jgi:hypothetical protein
MKNKIFSVLAAAFVVAFVFGVDAFAQGRGRGGGGGRPATAGPPTGVGVDRGLGNASTRSNGRSDDGLSTAATRSNGRSTTGIDRARLARANANALSDSDINRYRGLSQRLGITPDEVRAQYESALLLNPDLTFGNFVAAHMIADNLGRQGRFPNITSGAILTGLADGHSIGKTLRSLGMAKDEANDLDDDVKERIKAAKRRN